jgi:hypothetical protein
MRTYSKSVFSLWVFPVFSACAAGVIVFFTSTVEAQVFPAYSFEPDLQGFVGNPPTAAITVSLETSGLGATVGANSMKVELADFAGFAGPQTPTLHPAFTDPAGLDFIRFDLTNTNRYVPPDPVPGTTPTFANVSVVFEGEFASAPGTPAQIQFYPLNEVAIGDLEPGTHEVEISLQRDENVEGTGGLWVQGGQFKSWTEWITSGYTPFSFEVYFNKNVRVGGGPEWAWTVYMDNIRLVREVEGLPGDYNVDGSVDAADYVAWRKDPSLFGGDPDGYNTWRQHFSEPGGGDGGAVPEPASAILVLVAMGLGLAVRRRTV